MLRFLLCGSKNRPDKKGIKTVLFCSILARVAVRKIDLIKKGLRPPQSHLSRTPCSKNRPDKKGIKTVTILPVNKSLCSKNRPDKKGIKTG